MSEKVVKIPEELYNKVKAKADADGTSMAQALDALAQGEPLPNEVEAFIPSCALEAGVKMPTDYRWIKPLTEVLPPGLRGKLEPYAKVLECAEAKAALKKAAEEHLSEVETPEAEATEQSEPVATEAPEAETTPPAEASEAEPAEPVETAEPAEVLPEEVS